MADKINKVRVDGKDYLIGIGEQLGAELEWKLVASGTYDSTNSTDSKVVYNLDNVLEPNKLYYVERYDSNDGSTFTCQFRNGNINYSYGFGVEDKSIASETKQYIKVINGDDDSVIEGLLDYNYSTSNLQLFKNDVSIVNIQGLPISQGSDDTLEVYELTIKNVENPSNVVTPNKLNLYTTGTLDEEVQMDDYEIFYRLGKQLNPNKLYYVERFDPNVGVYTNCIIRTDSYCAVKCKTKMLAYESDTDSAIFANVSIHKSERNINDLFYINGETYPLYKDAEDTLEIYELPYTF